MTQCPIITAISEIRGGGIYADDMEQTTYSTIKLGGSDAPITFVCNDIIYYMMVRKLEFARFKLTKPSLLLCKNKAQRMFSGILGRDYAAVYVHILDTAIKKKYIYCQFTRLVNLIGRLEQLIISAVESAKEDVALNVSLPDIFLLPNVDKLIVYRTDVLHDVVNGIIQYINRLNINILLPEPLRLSIDKVDKYEGITLNMAEKVPSIHADSSAAYIDQMAVVLSHEMIVAEYARAVEEYHCYVINHMNKVFDVIHTMISGLLRPI
jgi:hypothetical protein